MSQDKPVLILQRAALLLRTYAEFGMEARDQNGDQTPNSVLSYQVAKELDDLAIERQGWISVPLEPTKEMVEAGAQRLVRWETGKETWPDSWSALDVRASRNDAERVWRSMWLAATPHASAQTGEPPLRTYEIIEGSFPQSINEPPQDNKAVLGLTGAPSSGCLPNTSGPVSGSPDKRIAELEYQLDQARWCDCPVGICRKHDLPHRRCKNIRA